MPSVLGVLSGVALALFTASLCICAGLLAVGGTDTSVSLVFASLLVALAIAVGVVRYRRSGGDLLDPLVVISAAVCWYFGIHTFWLLAGHVATRSFTNPFITSLPQALGWACAGYLFLVLGFWLPLPAAPRPSITNRTYRPSVLVLLFVAGMSANIVAAAAGAYAKIRLTQGPATANFLIYGTIGFTSVVAFAICCCQYYLDPGAPLSRTYRWLMWIMLVVLLVFALGVAQKSLAFEAIFAWVAARHYAGSPIRPRWAVVATMVALLLVAPIIQSARAPSESQVVGKQGTLTSVLHTTESAPGRVWTYINGLPGSALSGFDSVNGRTDGSESLALAYEYTPSRRPYQLGATWPEVFTSLVPHYIWPTKPVDHETEQFSIIYAGQSVERGAALAVAPTYPGNLYTNFGWPGILVGMFLLGVMLKLVANYRGTRGVTVAVPMYVAIMTAAVLLEHDVVTLGSNLLVQLLACRLTIAGLDGLTAGSLGPRRKAAVLRPAISHTSPSRD